MTKSIYEIRMDVLQLAHTISVDKNYAKSRILEEQMHANPDGFVVSELPTVDVKEVLKTADQLSKFVFSVDTKAKE